MVLKQEVMIQYVHLATHNLELRCTSFLKVQQQKKNNPIITHCADEKLAEVSVHITFLELLNKTAPQNSPKNVK